MWLATGKAAGLTFSEINELRICDIVSYADLVNGESVGDEVQMATSQEDIDKFYH